MAVEEGGVLSWDGAMGINSPGNIQNPNGPRICKVCAGCSFVAAISDNGDFHVWGTVPVIRFPRICVYLTAVILRQAKVSVV